MKDDEVRFGCDLVTKSEVICFVRDSDNFITTNICLTRFALLI